MEGTTQELAEVGGGLAIIEVGPDVVNEAFKDTPMQFQGKDVNGLQEAGGNLIEAAQEIAPVIAAAAVVYIGFKTMARGLKEEK